MKSSKWILGLTAIALIMALAPSSFAQVQIQLFNSPSPGEIQTIRHAVTSDPTSTGSGVLVSGALIANSVLSTTNLILTFPAPITTSGVTNNTGLGAGLAIPTQDPVRIEGASGLFAGITAITTMNYAAGTVTITLPCVGGGPPVVACGSPGAGTGGANNQSGSFRLVGVRIDANGKTAPLNVNASLSSSSNNYIIGTSSVGIIAAFAPGIGSFTQGSVSSTAQPNTGTMLILTNNTIGDGTASLAITEGIASGWRTATQESISGTPVTNATNMRLTFTGIPAGMTITLTPTNASGTGNRPSFCVSPGTVTAPTSTSPSLNQTTITLLTPAGTDPTPAGTCTTTTTVAPNLSAIDNIGLQLTIAGSATGTLSAGTITVVATMVPIGDALSPGSATEFVGAPTVTGGFPRFAQADTAAVTVGTIAVANTTLLAPYVLSGFGNYNTGIAVANTTADPFGATGGGATASAGSLTFTFYPNAGTGLGTGVSYSTTTAGRPGGGIDSSGNVPAGSTYAVLLSDLLTAAGRTGDFQGYVFIQANFLDAHGVAYIYQGPTLTSAVPILVLPPPIGAPRTGAEALNN